MPRTCQYSFWEKQSFSQYDYIIVGGGIVGLSAALSIREKHPSASVLLLERNFLPTGASTKNAGFACFGSATEIFDDLQNMSEQEVFELVQMRCNGLQLLRARLGDKAIDLKKYGGYELISENELYIIPQLTRINAIIEPLFREPVFRVNDDKIRRFKFRKVRHIVENPFEAQIDTGKMMRELMLLALSKKIEIKNGVEVTGWDDSGTMVSVELKNIDFELKSRKVIVCTNAFASTLLPDIDMYPGRGQVLITKPLEDLPFKGVFHFNKGYFYFRNFGRRVIFGGGRNKFLSQETTDTFGCTQNVLDLLKQKLQEIILPGQSFEIEQVWSGIMAFGKDKQPVLRQVSNNVYAAVRLGGMGVAIGSILGEKLVNEFDL